MSEQVRASFEQGQFWYTYFPNSAYLRKSYSELECTGMYIRSDTTLQMFAGNYRNSTGKSECRDFKFMGIACLPAIPVILKFHTLISVVIFAGNLILQGYYMDSLH